MSSKKPLTAPLKSAATDVPHPERSWLEIPFLKRWLLLCLVWVTIGLVFFLQLCFLNNVPPVNAARVALVDWGPWILISPLVLWFAGRIPIEGKTWKRGIVAHIMGCLLVAALFELTFLVATPSWSGDFGSRLHRRGDPWRSRRNDVFFSAPPRQDGPSFQSGPPMFFFVRARLSIPIYWVLVAAAQAVTYHRRSLERERRALLAEARLAEARLLVLQAQLQPHFLFNTLNTIASLIYENPKGADEMIITLSELLRSILNVSHRAEVPLKAELSMAEHYLSIQKIRFEDNLQVVRIIANDTLSAAVPTLLLQPLVENAVLHGLRDANGKGVITLRARRIDGDLCIEVTDNGPASPAAEGELKEGIGIGNTKARLQEIYGERQEFSFTTSATNGHCTRVRFPFRILPS